jgi:hypothetical protein
MSLPTYLGFPILDWEPDWKDPSRTLRFIQPKNRVGENSPGPMYDDAPHHERPRTTMRLRYVFEDRAQVVEAREFIRDVAKGRLKSFWVPIWSQAVHLAEAATDMDDQITVTRSGYANLYAGAGLGREHVALIPRIPGEALTLIPRKVESATLDEMEDVEVLALDSAIGEDVPVDGLVTFLILCRLDTDSPALRWESRSVAIMEMPLIDLPREAP